MKRATLVGRRRPRWSISCGQDRPTLVCNLTRALIRGRQRPLIVSTAEVYLGSVLRRRLEVPDVAHNPSDDPLGQGVADPLLIDALGDVFRMLKERLPDRAVN